MLTALIGLPRSGKDTLANKWLAEKDPNSRNRVWVSRDAVRLALYNKRFDPTREADVHFIYSNMVKSLLLNSNYHVMMNETNCSCKAVRSIFREYDVNAKFVFINTPIEECYNRAILTNQEDLIPIINSMYAGLLGLQKHANPNYDQFLQDDLVYRSIERIHQEVLAERIA